MGEHERARAEHRALETERPRHERVPSEKRTRDGTCGVEHEDTCRGAARREAERRCGLRGHRERHTEQERRNEEDRERREKGRRDSRALRAAVEEDVPGHDAIREPGNRLRRGRTRDSDEDEDHAELSGDWDAFERRDEPRRAPERDAGEERDEEDRERVGRRAGRDGDRASRVSRARAPRRRSRRWRAPRGAGEASHPRCEHDADGLVARAQDERESAHPGDFVHERRGSRAEEQNEHDGSGPAQVLRYRPKLAAGTSPSGSSLRAWTSTPSTAWGLQQDSRRVVAVNRTSMTALTTYIRPIPEPR